MWLLGALGSVRKLAGSVFSLMRAYPLQAAIIALVCLSAWLWHGKNVEREAKDAAQAQNAQILAASKEAEAMAIAARAAVEKRYKDIANAIDKEHAEQLVGARDATDSFIARNRVRAKAGGCPSGPAPTASNDNGSSVPAEVSADTFVAVSDSDVQACSGAVIYAVDAFKWANGLKQATQP